MSSNRRDFIENAAVSAEGLAVSSSVMGMSARSYGRIIGSNDRLNVGIIGLGRRLSAYYIPISKKGNNVEIRYLCNVIANPKVDLIIKEIHNGVIGTPYKAIAFYADKY